MLSFYLSLIEIHEYDDFERIYNRYKELMYCIARHHTGSHHLAEEALQIAFIGVAKNFDKIKVLEEKHLEIYLCKATKNCAFSVLRKENNPLNKNVSYDSELSTESTCEEITESVCKSELLSLIVDFIKTMKSEYADVLTMHFLHNLTLKECAIALNIPLSTVKTRLYKGQAMIQEKFKEYQGND